MPTRASAEVGAASKGWARQRSKCSRNASPSIADIAADAAIRQAYDVAIVLDAADKVGVDIDRAEVVHQHGHAQAVIAIEDAVEQSRLPRAKEAGEDGHGADPGRCLDHCRP